MSIKQDIQQFELGAAIRDAEVAELKTENEYLLKNLRGKHAVTGATYAHLITERDTLSDEVMLLREYFKMLDVAFKVGSPDYEFRDWCDMVSEALAKTKRHDRS